MFEKGATLGGSGATLYFELLLRILRRVRQTACCHQILLPGFVGGGS